MLRLMNKDDINEIINIENEALGHTLGFDMLNEIIDNPMMSAYVYEKDNKILGYISISFDGITLEILNFCVDVNNQNKGIGKEILTNLFEIYKNEGCKNVILDVRENNLRAIHVYESFGFKLIHKRIKYYDNKIDALIYEKKL